MRGQVQGVGFRYSTRREAQRLGLRATVWNRDDGGVECEAEGDAEALRQLAAWLRRGPPSARVERVEELA